MYRVYKRTGNGVVAVENTETHAYLVIGRVDPEIVHVLTEAGYDLPPFGEEWDMEISSECAKALSLLTMKMKKPIRDQRKKKPEEQKPSADVDIFDLIYGT